MTDRHPVKDNLRAVQAQVDQRANDVGHQVHLVAVSKTKPDEDLLAAYDAGQRDFGENRVQELVGKAARLPQDIRWHMIGHIQTNKIKDFLPCVHLVHGVDRIKVLDVLEREAAKLDRTVDLLLQVHIAAESTKFGFSSGELQDLAQPEVWEAYPHLRPVGLMGMATFTDDQAQVRGEFKSLHTLFHALKQPLHAVASARGAGWHTLSMGMSGDWPVAVEEGSTRVRVGRAIFGVRNTARP